MAEPCVQKSKRERDGSEDTQKRGADTEPDVLSEQIKPDGETT
jgi:hypothetical protein